MPLVLLASACLSISYVLPIYAFLCSPSHPYLWPCVPIVLISSIYYSSLRLYGLVFPLALFAAAFMTLQLKINLDAAESSALFLKQVIRHRGILHCPHPLNHFRDVVGVNEAEVEQ